MARRSRASSLPSVVGDGVDLESRASCRHLVVRGATRLEQRGQRARARRIDEQPADFAQCVIAGGARDRQRGLKRLRRRPGSSR